MHIDDELILNARRGDDKSLSILVEKYMEFAREKAKGFVSSPLEYDDIVQEAMLGFLSAFYTYDASGAASFKTYAGVCMNNRIITAVNAANRKKQVPRSSLVCLDEINAENTDISSDPEEFFLLREQAAEVRKRIDSELSPLEKQIFRLYFSGNSYEKIAFQLGLNPKSIDNALQRVRRKIRKALL